MNKLIISLTCALLTLTIARGQEYSEAIGIRGGAMPSFTYKKFLEADKAMEAFLSFRDGGMQLTAIRQMHRLEFYEHFNNLYFVKGFGVHLGYMFSDKTKFFWYEIQRSKPIFSPLFGLDAYWGVEMRLEEYPLVIGIDYKPFIEFSTATIFNIVPYDITFSVKYTFR